MGNKRFTVTNYNTREDDERVEFVNETEASSEKEESRQALREKMSDFISNYQSLVIITTPEKVLEWKKEGYSGVDALLRTSITKLTTSAKQLHDMIEKNSEVLEMTASVKKDQEGEVSPDDLEFRNQINNYSDKIKALETLKRTINDATDIEDLKAKVAAHFKDPPDEELNENLDDIKRSFFSLIDKIIQKFYDVQKTPSEEGYNLFVQLFDQLKKKLQAPTDPVANTDDDQGAPAERGLKGEVSDFISELENFDKDEDVPPNCPFVLTSPRSIEACKQLGVRVSQPFLNHMFHVIIKLF